MNATVAFLLELGVLTFVGIWAYHSVGRTMAPKVLAAIGAVALFGILWGLFGAPGAGVKLPTAGLIAFQVAWFAAGALALAATGRKFFAGIFFVVYLVSLVLAQIWHQQGG
ncbi:MAG TPA: YrdB family protein [Actinocrinis sp.]